MSANDDNDGAGGFDPRLQAIARRVRESFDGIPPAPAELEPIEVARADRDTRGPRR